MSTKEIKNKKTILVVEDDTSLQKAISFKLQSYGYNVLTARSVAEAFDHIKSVSYISVIWLDHYLLGKETGLDFVSKIKNHKEFKKIPIFVVSNTASTEKVATYLSFGVNKYYTKSNYRLDEIIKDLENDLG